MRVLIAAGGSGGHIFPAVALTRELMRDGCKILFVASRRRLDKNILRWETFKIFYLSVNPMPHRFGTTCILFIIKGIIDFFCAAYLLIYFRPDVVVGFGGYTAGVIVFLASIFGIKTVIHEQNVVPGKTNRFLDRFVNKVTVSFEPTKKYFKNKHIILTGNPIRKESLVNTKPLCFRKLNLSDRKFTILIIGGSQGAVSLNSLVKKTISLLENGHKRGIQIIHITGPRSYAEMKRFYEGEIFGHCVYDFIEDINDAYSACDMVISRSGAAVISELAVFGKPVILIPYPSSKNNQRFNAIYFAERKAAIYCDEMQTKPQWLKNMIIELVSNVEKRTELSNNIKKMSHTDGARRLKNEIKAIKTIS